MNDSTLNLTMAEQIADVARAFQRDRTGHSPGSVTVGLSGETLIVTLHEALSPAEVVLARTPEGAAQVQEYHRQLFAASAAALWQEIRRITGVPVREAGVEVETAAGDVVHAFTSGTMVQIFRLAGRIPPTAWLASGPPGLA